MTMADIATKITKKHSTLATVLAVCLFSRFAQSSRTCPELCACEDHLAVKVDCSRRNLTRIPRLTDVNTMHVELSWNNISHLEAGTFAYLENLKELHLENNQILSVDADTFKGLEKLEYLWLEGNQLTEVPVLALLPLSSLKVLWLSGNKLDALPNLGFRTLNNLIVLFLKDNQIQYVADEAFEGLSAVRVLEINSNRLRHIPVAMSSLPSLEDLAIGDNFMEYLPDDCFHGNPQMLVLQLRGNPVQSIGIRAFRNLPRLEKLILSEARDQTEFPDLSGTCSLEILGLDRAALRYIPEDLCEKAPLLRSLDVHSNRISSIPDLSACTELRVLNLGNNEIVRLESSPFKGLSQLRDLTLSNNYITHVPDSAFLGLVRLQYLDLMHNHIKEIEPEAFAALTQLEDLNLGENQLSNLPTAGLEKIKYLKLFDNRNLQDFVEPSVLPNIRLLTLSYAYHCCEFIETTHKSVDEIQLKEDIVWLSRDDYDIGLWRNMTHFWEPLDNSSINYDYLAQDIYDGFGTNYEYPDYLPPSASQYFEEYKPKDAHHDVIIPRPPVECKPVPGAFMPCVDLFGWWSLRCGVWIVFLLAVLGNGVVLFVSITSHSRMDVPRFLICNLACADFFMGIYLGFLAIVDMSTLGEFKRYAIGWQMSPGCLIAGFLAVLSSELSVFTLTVITLERFYAITHAMQLNKRLSIRNAGYFMIAGWLFSLLLATMPLFGISDYRKFAVCLPFETSDIMSLAYVCFIMVFNGISFLIIVSCYLKMYWSIRGTQTWNSNDSRVAKRMALLVFTDFACWAPITLFSLTAMFGKQLISLDEAKIFTIFVLPLNSCANPFLYAIFTKQFKKDCVHLCKRLEESSLSRRLTQITNRHLTWSLSSVRRASGTHSFLAGGTAEKRGSTSSREPSSLGVIHYNAGDDQGHSALHQPLLCHHTGTDRHTVV